MGLAMMASGVAGVLLQGFLVGPVVARIGERGALLLGAAGGALGFAWYGYAPTGVHYLMGIPIFALIGFLMPGLQGLMTRRVPPHQQGQLQGVNQSLQGIASMLGPALFGLTFAWSIRHEATLQAPGLAIYLASALLFAALVLGSRVARASEPAGAAPA